MLVVLFSNNEISSFTWFGKSNVNWHSKLPKRTWKYLTEPFYKEKRYIRVLSKVNQNTTANHLDKKIILKEVFCFKTKKQWIYQITLVGTVITLPTFACLFHETVFFTMFPFVIDHILYHSLFGNKLKLYIWRQYRLYSVYIPLHYVV